VIEKIETTIPACGSKKPVRLALDPRDGTVQLTLPVSFRPTRVSLDDLRTAEAELRERATGLDPLSPR
jgi:hypothetical protein